MSTRSGTGIKRAGQRNRRTVAKGHKVRRIRRIRRVRRVRTASPIDQWLVIIVSSLEFGPSFLPFVPSFLPLESSQVSRTKLLQPRRWPIASHLIVEEVGARLPEESKLRHSEAAMRRNYLTP
jgi:hypothetical protein